MKSVQVVARGRAEFVEVANPEVKPGYVTVRTAYLSLCGSDIRMLHYAAADCYPFPPGTSGHEMVGTVAAVAPGESHFRVGDQVLALAPGHRAMCEYFLAPIEHVIPLPAGKPMEVLLQAQQLGTVMYAAQRLPSLLGKEVAIIGQGSAGLWFNYLVSRLGAKRIVALDVDAGRLERSRLFGATDVIHNAAVDPQVALQDCLEGRLADVVIEAAGEASAINLAVDLARQYGDILFFGCPRGQSMPFNIESFFYKCCRATAIVGASAEANQNSTRMAVKLISQGQAPAEELITHHLKFDEVIDAYEMHHRRTDGCLKIVIEMPGASA